MVFGINAAGSTMSSFIQTSAKSPKATENLLQGLGKNIIDARVAEKKMVSHGLWGGLALAAAIPLGLAAAHVIPIAGPAVAALGGIGHAAASLPFGIGALIAKTGLGLGTTAAAAPAYAGVLAWGSGITGGIANAVGLVFRGHRDALLKPVEDLTKHTAQQVAQKVTQQVAQEGGEVLANQATKSNPFAMLGLGAAGGLGVATLSGGGDKD